MSTNPGERTWADAGLVPPDSSAVPDPDRTTVPVPAENQPRAPRPDLLAEAEVPEADALEQQQELPDDDSEEYPPG